MNSRPLFFAAILFGSFIFLFHHQHLPLHGRNENQRNGGRATHLRWKARAKAVTPASFLHSTNGWWQHFCWQKGSSSSYRLGLLTCGGKPVVFIVSFAVPLAQRHCRMSIEFLSEWGVWDCRLARLLAGYPESMIHIRKSIDTWYR